MNLARAVTIGIAVSLVGGGNLWRTIPATVLLILALLLTDWIAEDAAMKRQREFAAKLLRGVKGVRDV